MTEENPGNGNKRIVYVCQGTGCVSGKAFEITEALKKAVQSQGLEGVSIDFTGCHGFCEQGPVAIVEPEGKRIGGTSGVYRNCTIFSDNVRPGMPVYVRPRPPCGIP